MSKIDKLSNRISKFLDLMYPNEPLWKRRLRSWSIKTYIIWNKEDNIARNTKRDG